MAAVIPLETSDRSAGEALGERIAELNAYLNVAEAEFLELLRTFDSERYWEDLGFTSCAHWLNFKCGLGLNAARERLRMAHALVKLPGIRAGFAEGRLSFSKVRAMTRVATPENEELLLDIARHGTAYHVERYVSHYRRIEKLREPGFAQALYEQRELCHYFDADGCLVIKARLPAEQGELVVKALERAMEQATDSATDQVTDQSPHQGTGQATDPQDAVASEEREPIAARRADALCDVAEAYLNHPDNAGSTADRYQVVLHVHPKGTKSAEKDSADSATEPCIENGPHVSAETSERIACDCSVTTLLEDQNGEPLNIGRRSRTIPPPMRRALIARDGGCRFPGCTRHRFCDGHHIEHWQHGGETRLDNLVLLCRHHHRLVHEGGFDCRKSETGEIFFLDARQRRLKDHESPTSVSRAETLAWLQRRFDGFGLDGNACAAEWYAGDTMDWDHAMSVAFQQPVAAFESG